MLGYQITVFAAGKDIGRWQGWLDGLQDAGLAIGGGDGYPYRYVTTVSAAESIFSTHYTTEACCFETRKSRSRPGGETRRKGET